MVAKVITKTSQSSRVPLKLSVYCSRCTSAKSYDSPPLHQSTNFNPQLKIFKSSDSPYSETVLDWEVGLGESLDNLDQKIALLRSEKPFIAKASSDSTFYSAADYFSDQHIDQIAADIQSLSSELSQFNF